MKLLISSFNSILTTITSFSVNEIMFFLFKSEKKERKKKVPGFKFYLYQRIQSPAHGPTEALDQIQLLIKHTVYQ